MKAETHQQRALQLEHANDILGDPERDPGVAPTMIENYWGAAFH